MTGRTFAFALFCLHFFSKPVGSADSRYAKGTVALTG